MKKSVHARISYRITDDHSDIKYFSDPGALHVFEDTYYFSSDMWQDMRDYCIDTIKGDLLLVASGGYDYSFSTLIDPIIEIEGITV